MIDAQTGGSIGFSRAVLRFFAAILSALVFYLGYFWMLWDSEKQTWHDKIAGDVVVPVSAYPVESWPGHASATVAPVAVETATPPAADPAAGAERRRRSRKSSSGSSRSARSSGAAELGRVRGPVAVERRVEAAPREQLLVRALLDDAAVLEHDDQVRIADRREPVRDDECGSVLEQQMQRLLDLSLGADVDRRRRLVEDQDPRVGEQRARERDQLALAEREA